MDHKFKIIGPCKYKGLKTRNGNKLVNKKKPTSHPKARGGD
jgi:hypothetical protein